MATPDFHLPDDRLFPSDNEYEIPNLRLDRQPKTGLLLPFAPWGAFSRRKRNIATYHFYVDDNRFQNIWLHPEKLIYTGCQECVEPNFSLFDTTPIAYGLQLIYKKRWIARWLQECGIRVWVDLHVSHKFYELNRHGIPNGYNAFATRGVAASPHFVLHELSIAREISGEDSPNFVVYGGGEPIKRLCQENNLLYVEQFMSTRITREEVNHG